ncbi:MAG: acyl--CoA ligase [Prevotella sp.]|jgi:acyl-CoA synthetase (AMP-forming)/AMP-acid ligase II|nr:class I adenylate-forming enzyme family protein [Prevotella sp.]MCH3985543.1 acyl--CoA ligase [Prevotella sp.]MCH4017684.1 acyl--CoA ligase [Prevotella sp.]MCH4186901.1 acyl--CoA ligase [Prevotella sp.]MCH4216879.1 acyl--CoA ligase [Prevotella sp.]MCH4251400.1 acyl--CoA ligase [Prevotella sp.]
MKDFKSIFESHYTWIEGFMRNVMRYSGKLAMVDPDRDKTWTYADLNRDCNRLANALIHDGLKKGDVIMMQLPNCPEFVFTYITAHKTHAVNCPVSYRLSPGELAENLRDSQPSFILFDSARKEGMLEALKISGLKPKRLIVTDGESKDEVISYSDYIKNAPGTEPAYTCAYNIYDETTRLYTSGTTGHAKGVPLTSINEVLSSHDVMIHFPMSYKDVTMNTTPWFHRGGLHCAGPCPTFYAGATLVIMTKFDAIKTLAYIAKYKITFLIGVPTVLEKLADEQERQSFDLSTLKGIVTMGSPLERFACIRYQKVLTPNIFNGYGTTETFWNTFLRPFDLPENAGTAGSSCVDDDVRVVKIHEGRRSEPDDLVTKDGHDIGEVIICSPAKSPYRYVNNDAETESKYYKDFIYTGDLATWDENQFLTIVGRRDDMIISSGENIYPTQIEEVLNSNPKVKDCMVTSVPDKIRGQVVTAYIVREDDSLTAEELDDYCKKNLNMANFKRPRFYRFVSHIPFNATGKKLHGKLREIAHEDLKNGLLYQV